MGKNEVVTVENKSKRGFWFRNNKSEVMVSEDVCVDIANLGYQLVSVAGTVAMKYLDKKLNAYHECVDANIKNNELWLRSYHRSIQKQCRYRCDFFRWNCCRA